MTEPTAERAFEIADEAMFSPLECECVAHDEFRTVLGLADEQCQEVASLAEASAAIREAVEWLIPRGYVELASDPSGEYVSVLRRPGEDEEC